MQSLLPCKAPAAHQELLLGDEVGFVYLWNIAAEKCLKCERLHEAGAVATNNRAALTIRDLSVSNGELLVSRAASCDYWLLVRDQKYSEAKGHTGAVIALGVHEAKGEASAEDEAVYSASLDNTIRAWNPYDMSSLSVLQHGRGRRPGYGRAGHLRRHPPLCLRTAATWALAQGHGSLGPAGAALEPL